MIRNPISGRSIQLNGPTYTKLMKAGYKHIGSILVAPIIEPVKILSPPIPDDTLILIFSYLELKDILEGYLINRVVATILSSGYHVYGKSIVNHMLSMKRSGRVLKYMEPVLSDIDITLFFDGMEITPFRRYNKHIDIVNIYMGPNSRSWKILDIILMHKRNKGIYDLLTEYKRELYAYVHHTVPKVYNLSYSKNTLSLRTNFYSIEDYSYLNKKNNSPSISDIQIMCMKYGFKEYSKINSSNKDIALSELKSIMEQ